MSPHLLPLLTSRWLDYYHTWRASRRRIPIIGTFCRVSSPLLEVPLAQGVTFWVPTHAPQVSATHPGSVSTFLSHHAPGSSLGMTLSWVVTIPGITLKWRGLHEPGYSPLVLELWPWSHLYWYYNCGLKAIFFLSLTWPLAISSPPQSFLPMGIGGRRHRRLILAMPSAPYTGDSLYWRRLILATPHPPSSGPSMSPTVSLTLTLVNDRGRDGTSASVHKTALNKTLFFVFLH